MDAFAKFYDALVGADYNKISSFIDKTIKKFKPDSELVCDLGCGTGIIACNLSKLGYDMIGIDISDDMLAKARVNAANSNVDNLLLLCQDICDFELYGTVDVIYSTLDTINYITDKNELKRLFKLVKNYLNYNGLFIFDINTDYKFRSILGNNNFIYDNDDLFCSWSSEYSDKTGFCYHALTYFEALEDGKYVKTESEQIQRYYSTEYIDTLLNKFGFEVLKRVDNYSDKFITDKTQRITYVLKINK